jgi:hypothetical protein
MSFTIATDTETRMSSSISTAIMLNACGVVEIENDFEFDDWAVQVVFNKKFGPFAEGDVGHLTVDTSGLVTILGVSQETKEEIENEHGGGWYENESDPRISKHTFKFTGMFEEVSSNKNEKTRSSDTLSRVPHSQNDDKVNNYLVTYERDDARPDDFDLPRKWIFRTKLSPEGAYVALAAFHEIDFNIELFNGKIPRNVEVIDDLESFLK